MIVKSVGTAVPNFTLVTATATLRLSDGTLGVDGLERAPHAAARNVAEKAASQ
jgi:hypothetical protein